MEMTAVAPATWVPAHAKDARVHWAECLEAAPTRVVAATASAGISAAGASSITAPISPRALQNGKGAGSTPDGKRRQSGRFAWHVDC